jgi:hypothetical protein
MNLPKDVRRAWWNLHCVNSLLQSMMKGLTMVDVARIGGLPPASGIGE